MAMPLNEEESPELIKELSIERWVKSKNLFTVPEIAKALNVSNMTIYRKITNGKLKAVPGLDQPKRVIQSELAKFVGVDLEEN